MKKQKPKVYPFYLGRDKMCMECRFCPLRADCFSDKLFSKDPYGGIKRGVKRMRYWGMSPFKLKLARLRTSITVSVLSFSPKPCFVHITCSSNSSQESKNAESFSNEKSGCM